MEIKVGDDDLVIIVYKEGDRYTSEVIKLQWQHIKKR